MKISMKRKRKVGIEDIIYDSLDLRCFFNAESGIDSSVMIMNDIIVIVPQKNAISMASFLLISC